MDGQPVSNPLKVRSRSGQMVLGIICVVLSSWSMSLHLCIAPLDPWWFDAPMWLALDLMPGRDAQIAKSSELMPWMMLAHLAGVTLAGLLLTTGILFIQGRRLAPHLGIIWVVSKIALAFAFGWLTLLVFDAQVAAIPDPKVPRYTAGVVELGLWTGNLPLLLARTIPAVVLLGFFVWYLRRRPSA